MSRAPPPPATTGRGSRGSPTTSSRARARELQALLDSTRPGAGAPPLLGIPFAVKDSIDVAGLDTTVACPAYAYAPVRSAPIVDRLEAAGTICVGKTNLDQFASGLVGVRSPYGVSRNLFHPDYIPGGSSSGSAVAVELGPRELQPRHRRGRLGRSPPRSTT